MSESKSRPLLMIPGPIEYHEDVLAALGEPSPSHVQADFIETFGRALELFRDVLQTKKGNGQPLILSGSGTLGWDIIASNLIEPQEHALVVNTGYFSDSFADCLQTYGAVVEQVHAPAIGDTVSLEALSQSLKGKKFKLVALTQVDTSTGVLNNVRAMAELIRKESPDTLIAVDGVCSFGGEEFLFDGWGIDAAMTCSQKALGVPPGLSLLMLSQNALAAFNTRTAKVANYYANLKNWLPIMAAYEARQPSYFATPAVNLIKAMHKSLDMIVSSPGGVAGRISQHVRVAQAFQGAIHSMGLTLVPARPEITAHTLSAIRLPQGVKGPDLLGKIRVGGVTLAGGLHKQIKAEYFRVGHMGVSVTDPHRKHMLTTLHAIESALIELGAAVPAGKAAQEFEKLLI